ncbi:multicomponent Na+:H+ antiporter subunit B [Amycolatopsis marina]|uniref:Multicomponent Na+:H+ antiporter subunit B n=1 Tax=Amycolatopsis marina TaxID=490629 RepID=A0A1I0ZCJ6_9PSEU|nr:MnhB domain-containing protein [Amycolatopsis marina]SFB23364.1 multicomponent Na+:H+ antiporter subunit B [Amycolatopsis marina]
MNQDADTPAEQGLWGQWDQPAQRWLLAGQTRHGWRRSLLLEVSIRILFPTVLVVSIYLLFAGHHDAGGGFSGGLVAGLAFVLRYVAGGSEELAAAVRISPPVVMGAGLSLAVLTALTPVAFGGPVLSSEIWTAHPPLLGELELPSSVVFDAGIYLLVTGAVLELLRTLGAGIETRELEEQVRETRRDGDQRAEEEGPR